MGASPRVLEMTADDRIALQGMTIKQIRRAQGIVAAQLPLAYAQRNTSALEHLQAWDRNYAAELCRRDPVLAAIEAEEE